MPYSPSALEMFQQCQRRYMKRYVEKLKEPETDPMVVGSAFHEWVAAYVRHCFKKRTTRDDEMGMQLLTKHRGVLTPRQFQDLQPIVEGYLRKRTLPEFEEEPKVEDFVAVTADWRPCRPFDADCYLRGKMDLRWVEDGAEGKLVVIEDEKTGRRIPSQSELEGSIQLVAYGAMATALHPEVNEFAFVWRYARKMVERRLLMERAEAEACRETVDAVIAEVRACEESGAWGTSPSRLCGWCGFVGDCPAMNKALQVAERRSLSSLEIRSEQDALRAYELGQSLKGLRDTIDELLKEWVERHGPVVSGDRSLDFHPVATVTFDDPEAVAKKLLELGLDRGEVWRVFSTSKTAIERELRRMKRRGLIPDVIAVGEQGTETRFGFQQTKKEGGDR
jgi:hypothetical protein